MDGKSIIGLIIAGLLILFIFRYLTSNVNTLTSLTSAENVQTIQASSLASSSTSSSGNSTNFTYSIWFYIDDWNYRYGEPKVIFGRTTGKGDMEPCPSVVLAPIQNNIVVSMAVYPGLDDSSSTTTDASGNEAVVYSVHNCPLANIPIQRWVNLLISVYGRTMDVYMDGKLVKTCILAGVSYINSSAPVYITPNGGFSGWTSKFQYWPNSTNPQRAWDIYKAGYGGSIFGNLFGKYSLQISLMQGDTVENSWSM